IQISYAFVIGLVFGAGYLRTESLPLLVSAHWGIDFTSQIFQTDDRGFTAGEKIALVLLLAGLVVYAIRLMRKNDGRKTDEAGKMDPFGEKIEREK
ncbi:MAG: CPBP family intramembrane metalloprotease, partial [Bacillota bacterium]|nr:CPBP family intramembrane metalloprotease [Bacillota bacterium]